MANIKDTFLHWFEPLDPDEPLGKIYVYPFTLPTGITFATTELDVVDATSTTVMGTPNVTVTEKTVVNLSGVSWEIGFRAQGTGVTGNAYVRLRYALSNGSGDDVTGILKIAQR